LVRAAAPRADASKVLSALQRYGLVSSSDQGFVRLTADGFLTWGEEPGVELALSHVALEALTETCYSNLRARQRPDKSPRIQRTVYTDYIDHRHRRAYDEFLNESAQAFLTMHEAWLMRHEVKNSDSRRKTLTRAGVGLFAIRHR
jgi:hypothetical protein